jgi:Leucine-rich repeat (LRR) protein
LISLSIRSKQIKELQLPPKLQHLDLSGCSNLLKLPTLPTTLRKLNCSDCTALKSLPRSLSSTAVAELNCSGCKLKSLPQLPKSLVHLELEHCENLRCLPALPEGLERLLLQASDKLPEVSRMHAVRRTTQ